MKSIRIRCFTFCLLLGLLAAGVASATIPPKPGVKWPDAFRQYMQRSSTALQGSRNFNPLMRRIRANRSAVRGGTMTIEAARAVGGTAVTADRGAP